MPDITHYHMRDANGHLLWVDPLDSEARVYALGERFIHDRVEYKVKMIAIAENTCHVNIEVVKEDVIVNYPHL